MKEKMINNGMEVHIVKNCENDNLELLKSEKYDADYAHERNEYRRFLDELLKNWNNYYKKYKNTKETDYFSFFTYRYNEVFQYIDNFLRSYNLGDIEKNDNITYEDGRQKLIIKFNCTTKELISAIYQEIQMLEYYNKTSDTIKKEYQEFLFRDKERYAKIIPYQNLSYLYNWGYIYSKIVDQIPANVLYRVVKLIEDNNLFIKDELNNIDIEKYIKALLNIGLTPEMIKFITNFEEEFLVNKALEQVKSR